MATLEDNLHDLSRLSVAQERTIDGLRADLRTERADNAALRAENQRLREAIQGIFDAKEYNGDRWVGALYHAQQKALSVLAQNPIAHEQGETGEK